jgi:CRP/FNR family transcriptional regulator, anaerobic regulatory protein
MDDDHSTFHGGSSAQCSTCTIRSRCVINKIATKEVDVLSASYITRSSLKEGQYLYRRGDPFSGVFSLRYGSVKTELLFEDGVTQVTNFSISGAILGLDGVGSRKYQLDCICLSAVEVCFIPITDLGKMAKTYPELVGSLGSALGIMLNESTAHNYDLMHLNSLERLSDFLISHSNHLSMAGYDRDDFILTMSRPDLANYLGITVETLSRSLTHLEKIGALEVTNRHIKFLSRDPIFKLIDSKITRERHDAEKRGAHVYPSFVEKRKT